MAEENKAHDEAKAKGKGGIIPWVVVGVLSAGAGSAVPMFLPAKAETVKAEGETAVVEKKQERKTRKEDEPTVFVPFGDPEKDQRVVVNLNEGRMTRYLAVAITLEIPQSLELEFPKLLESKKAQLRNWLLSEISDKDLEEIRGAAGQNRLRRAIGEHFNSVLFPDGYDRIHDVLFEEFNVQ